MDGQVTTKLVVGIASVNGSRRLTSLDLRDRNGMEIDWPGRLLWR
jgi:hypothetical protein